MTAEPPWLRVKSDGTFGRWHMPVGGRAGFVLTACDLRLREGVIERELDGIALNQRCEACQGLHGARQEAA